MKASNILIALGGIGITLSAVGLVLDQLYPSQLYFTEFPQEARRTARSTPQHITIPDLALDLPVEPGGIIGGDWSVSNTAANHLGTSARPGDKGNIVIYGHDSRAVFARLKKAEVGQVITVTDKAGKNHLYHIEKIFSVMPDDVDVVGPTDTEILTVYTCTGLFNEQRLVIQAIPA